MRRLLVALLLCIFSALPAYAVLPDERLADPAQEARARVLSAELRCMVCQNQSIDDSDADLARDLRLLLRERIRAGDTNGQVLDYLVARYGEFVLLKPRWSARNALLWLTPVLILLAGGAAILLAARQRQTGSAKPLDSEETARLDEVLGDRH